MGTAAPSRRPRPPAAMIAVACMGWSLRPRRRRPRRARPVAGRNLLIIRLISLVSPVATRRASRRAQIGQPPYGSGGSIVTSRRVHQGFDRSQRDASTDHPRPHAVASRRRAGRRVETDRSGPSRAPRRAPPAARPTRPLRVERRRSRTGFARANRSPLRTETSSRTIRRARTGRTLRLRVLTSFTLPFRLVHVRAHRLAHLLGESARALGVASRPSVDTGSCTTSARGPGRSSAVLEHHVPAAGDRDRHDRQARLDGQQEAAALEPADASRPRSVCPPGTRSATAPSTPGPSSASGCRAGRVSCDRRAGARSG